MRGYCLAAFLVSACCTFLVWTKAQADKPEPDPRLGQKVTVSAVAAPLSDVLADLSKQTGVSLDLHRNLTDQKVTVLVDDQPLSVVMNSLRDLLDGLWFTEKVDGKTGYFLQQKYGTKEYAAGLRAERKAEQERKEATFRERVRETARIAGLPREQLLAMLNSDPRSVIDALGRGWRANMQPPSPSGWNCGAPYGSGGLFGTASILGSLSDEQWDLVFNGPHLKIPYNDLPEAARLLVDRAVGMMDLDPGHPLSGVDPGLLNLYVYRTPACDLSVGAPDEVKADAGRAWGSLGLRLVEGLGDVSAFGPFAPRIQDAAKALGFTDAELGARLEATAQGREVLSPPKPKPPTPEEKARQAQALEQWREDNRAVPPEEGLDLDLDRDRRLEPGENVPHPFEDVLEAIHRKAGVQIIADSYVVSRDERFHSRLVPKAPDKMMPWVARRFGRAATRDAESGVYRLRSTTWYEQDMLDPPLWLIKRLQPCQLDRGARYDLDDFLETVKTLSDEQLEAVGGRFCYRTYSGVVGAAGNCMPPRSGLLRFYASLDAGQRMKLLGEGIRASDLGPAQREAFAECTGRVLWTPVHDAQVARATLRMSIDEKEEATPQGKWLFRDAVFIAALPGREEKTDLMLASMPVAPAAGEASP